MRGGGENGGSMGCGWKESFYFEGMHTAGSSLLGAEPGGLDAGKDGSGQWLALKANDWMGHLWGH